MLSASIKKQFEQRQPLLTIQHLAQQESQIQTASRLTRRNFTLQTIQNTSSPRYRLTITRHLNQRLKQQHTLPGRKTANIPEQLQQMTENTTRTDKNPTARSRSSNEPKLITHVLSNQITRNSSNTALSVLNPTNPDLKRAMNLKPLTPKPSLRDEPTTIQQMQDTKTLGCTNTTILKLRPKNLRPTNPLHQNLERLLNRTPRRWTRSQRQETQIRTNTLTDAQTRQGTTITTPLLRRPPASNKRPETPLTITTLAIASYLVTAESAYRDSAIIAPSDYLLERSLIHANLRWLDSITRTNQSD